ncbi:MAG: virulence factor, partial [Parcubacteria group bacterium Gr01-1014_66]
MKKIIGLRMLTREISQVYAAAFLIGSAGVASRLFGILRDRILAARFGAGRELDIYYAAFQIPDLLATLFLLGAGSSVILPFFQARVEEHREEAYRFIARLLIIFISSALLCLLISLFMAPRLVSLIVPGFSLEERAITTALTRIMLLSPLFLGISWILSSVAESFHRFWAYAMAPLCYNVGIIIGILFFSPQWGLWGLGGGVVLGAFLHLATQIFAVRDLWRWRVLFTEEIKLLMRPARLFESRVREVMRISLPRVLSLSFNRLTLMILIGIGSWFAQGSIAVFTLAQNLYFVPVGVFGLSYTVALFPHMSRAWREKEGKNFLAHVFLGIRSISFWIIPISVLLIVLRAHVAHERIEHRHAGAMADHMRVHGEQKQTALRDGSVKLALPDREHLAGRRMRAQPAAAVHAEVGIIVSNPLHRQLDHPGRLAVFHQLVGRVRLRDAARV